MPCWIETGLGNEDGGLGRYRAATVSATFRLDAGNHTQTAPSDDGRHLFTKCPSSRRRFSISSELSSFPGRPWGHSVSAIHGRPVPDRPARGVTRPMRKISIHVPNTRSTRSPPES